METLWFVLKCVVFKLVLIDRTQQKHFWWFLFSSELSKWKRHFAFDESPDHLSWWHHSEQERVCFLSEAIFAFIVIYSTLKFLPWFLKTDCKFWKWPGRFPIDEMRINACSESHSTHMFLYWSYFMHWILKIFTGKLWLEVLAERTNEIKWNLLDAFNGTSRSCCKTWLSHRLILRIFVCKIWCKGWLKPLNQHIENRTYAL